MPDHLALVMEVADGGSLTTYVAEQWAHATAGGLILTEDEGRYFFRVRWVASCAPSGARLGTSVLDGVSSACTASAMLRSQHASFCSQQFVEAVDYCHKHGIAHRSGCA